MCLLASCKFPPPPDVRDDDAATDAATGCVADVDCESRFCEAGACIATDDVVYVKRGEPDTTACTAAAKCGTPAYALTMVTPTRKYLRIEPSAVAYLASPDGPVSIATAVVIHGDGAILERAGANEIVNVTADADAVLVGLTVRNAAGGADADGIKCNNAKLTLRRVTTAGNADRGLDAGNCIVDIDRTEVSSNTAGGIRIVSGRFSITNSFILRNGTTNSAAGGLILNPDQAPNTVEFSTVVANTAPNGAGGLLCLGTAVTARNNLIYGNTGMSETTGANCTHSYSVIGAANPPGGTMVRSMTAAEVALVNPAGSTVADFHIRPTSLLRGAAEPGSASGATAVDFDGQPRPSPAGGAADIGADEVP